MTGGAGNLRSLAFFGGGTGGHLYPGIAVAERATERFPGCRAVFFRTGRAVEERVFAGREIETRRLAVRPPGKTPLGWVRYSREAAAARRTILAEIRRGVDAAFGLGGYASLPGILAARAAGIPVILLEQNVDPGRVTRLMAPFVAAVACSHPEAAVRLSRRARVTGNPVRREVIEAARARRERPPAGPRRQVLVVGGSQGSQAINRAIREALGALADFRDRIRWIHVAGDADKDGMQEAYRTHGWDAEVLEYSAGLPEIMAASDLAICRAGGTTLSELAVVGLPSVLVPYPHHRDEHQLHNAMALVRRDGAILLPEGELGAESLRTVFRDVLLAPARLDAMGRGAQSLARPGASDAVLDLALESLRRCLPASVSSS